MLLALSSSVARADPPPSPPTPSFEPPTPPTPPGPPPTEGLLGHTVVVMLASGRALAGRLVEEHAGELTLLLPDGSTARVQRSEVVSLTQSAVDIASDPSSERRRVLAVADDLEQRASRKLTAGKFLTGWGIASLVACIIGIFMIETDPGLEGDRGFIGLLTAIVAGPIGTVLLAVGVPLYAAGASEQEVVEALRRSEGAPGVTSPGMSLRPGGSTRGLTLSVHF